MRRGAMKRMAMRGVALPLVLWAVFVMSTIMVVVVGLVDFDVDLEGLSARRASARQLAMTGLALGSHPKIKPGDPLLHQTLPDGTRLEVMVQSEDARLNINQLLAKGDSSALQRLFQFWGVPEKEAQVAVDSLKDWIDTDEFKGLNGAEASDLAGQTEFSQPENRPFIQIAEMKSVRGMDAVSRVKPDWADFFSVKSSGKLDLQDVSTDLLQVFGGLSVDQAQAFVTYRLGPDGQPSTLDDPPVKTVEALSAVIPLSGSQLAMCSQAFGGKGEIRRIISRGHCGGLVYEISTIGGEKGGCMEWVER